MFIPREANGADTGLIVLQGECFDVDSKGDVHVQQASKRGLDTFVTCRILGMVNDANPRVFIEARCMVDQGLHCLLDLRSDLYWVIENGLPARQILGLHVVIRVYYVTQIGFCFGQASQGFEVVGISTQHILHLNVVEDLSELFVDVLTHLFDWCLLLVGVVIQGDQDYIIGIQAKGCEVRSTDLIGLNLRYQDAYRVCVTVLFAVGEITHGVLSKQDAAC